MCRSRLRIRRCHYLCTSVGLFLYARGATRLHIWFLLVQFSLRWPGCSQQNAMRLAHNSEIYSPFLADSRFWLSCIQKRQFIRHMLFSNAHHFITCGFLSYTRQRLSTLFYFLLALRHIFPHLYRSLY